MHTRKYMKLKGKCCCPGLLHVWMFYSEGDTTSNKVLEQGYVKERLKSSSKKFLVDEGIFSNNTKFLSHECLMTFCSLTKLSTDQTLYLVVTFLVHLSQRLKCTIVSTRCPSSVVRPSVVRPSVVNFSHFQLILWNHWPKFNETWQEARSQCLLPSLCFSGRSEKQDGRPGLWLAETFFDFSSETAERNSTKLDREARSQRLLPCLCFSVRFEKQDGRPGLWLAETFSTFHLKPLNGFNKTWQEARSQSPLLSLCFSGWSVNKCPLWPIPKKDGTLYSGTRYVALWASCL